MTQLLLLILFMLFLFLGTMILTGIHQDLKRQSRGLLLLFVITIDLMFAFSSCEAQKSCQMWSSILVMELIILSHKIRKRSLFLLFQINVVICFLMIDITNPYLNIGFILGLLIIQTGLWKQIHTKRHIWLILSHFGTFSWGFYLVNQMKSNLILYLALYLLMLFLVLLFYHLSKYYNRKLYQYAYHAYYDQDTDIFNMNYLRDHTSKLEALGLNYTLLIIDLPRSKVQAQNQGTVRSIVQRLNRDKRPNEILGRVNEQRFYFLVPDPWSRERAQALTVHWQGTLKMQCMIKMITQNAEYDYRVD